MSWLREPDAEPIPGYTLVCPLGTGGFGEVWKCIAPGNILKAIKFVYGNLNSLDGDAYRAEQELRAMEKVKEVRHPFILSMERIDIVEGDLAIIMELADRSLHDLLQEHQVAGRPGIPRTDLLRYLRDAADGLDHLNNRHSLQHLDVKPRNLFLIGDRVKVADFGLVKNLERQSSSGLMVGVTPIYAAPETFSGKFTRHSDQYSLAVVYCELLTGRRPFNGKNIRALALQHVSEAPDLTGIPDHDHPAILRAMAKDPDQRWPSCMSFVRALEEAGPKRDAVKVAASPASSTTSTSPTRSTSNLPRHAEELSGLERTRFSDEVSALRPTVILGLGDFGRRAMLDLRCRLLDRFGDLSQVPIFRFLYIDSDPQSLHRAQQGEPDVALNGAQVFPLPLQPVANYRRRALEHLNDWMPREKLYSIPRSLQPQGSRALGRLAFHDNYLRLMTRLRRELQYATHPESLAQSVSQTGLLLSDHQPRVIVLASSCGGSSGMLVDLAYATCRQIQQLHLKVSRPTLFLYCGAPADPATPAQELANLHATLTELNHFQASDTSFQAQYGPDSQPVRDDGPPYSAAYLLTLENRTPEAQTDCLGHLATYLSHELSSTVGNRLDQLRQQGVPGMTAFRSLGTHSIWFPRGLLLRVAARQVCDGLLDQWQAVEYEGPSHEVEAVAARALSDPGLRWDDLASQIERSASTSEGAPPEVVARLLEELSQEAARPDIAADPGPWAQRVIGQIEEWIGSRISGADESRLRRSRFSLQYADASQHVAEDWAQRLTSAVSPLMDLPGRRTAGIGRALQSLMAFCEQAAAAQADVVNKQRTMVDASREQLRHALDACRSGAGALSRILGVGAGRSTRQFLDQVRIFAYARLAEETLEAGVQFFKKLRGLLEDRLTDLSFVRHRLRLLQQTLAEPAVLACDPSSVGADFDSPLGNLIHGSRTVRVVLPNGLKDLEAAASQFVEHLSPDQYVRLDAALQTLVLAPLGGLQAVCRKNSDLGQLLAGAMIDQAAAFLSEQLPISDVSDVEISAAARKNQPLQHHLLKFFRAASPLLSAPYERDQVAFLLHPPGPSSETVIAAARQVLPQIEFVPCSNPTDMTFCREQGFLTHGELAPLLDLCQAAYDDVCHAPAMSPHARFDVAEWLPLEV